jgi:hypothetical protein
MFIVANGAPNASAERQRSASSARVPIGISGLWVAVQCQRYRRWVFVSDLGHFLGLPDDAPGPAMRMAEQLSADRAGRDGQCCGLWLGEALPCMRPPGHRACSGTIEVARIDVPPSIYWRCTSCGDDGVIRGWEQSPFDLRCGPGAKDGEGIVVVVDAGVAATLRSLMLLDIASERLVFRAGVTERGVTLAGDGDDFQD